MLSALGVVTGTVIGVMSGVEFAVSAFVGPMLRSLSPGPSIEANAYGGRVLGRVMPPWYIASLLLTAWLAAVTHGGTATGSAIVAAGLQVAVAVLSLAVLVPINNRSSTWTADNHPDNWREQHRRWDRLNYVRIALNIGALVLVLVAVALG